MPFTTSAMGALWILLSNADGCSVFVFPWASSSEPRGHRSPQRCRRPNPTAAHGPSPRTHPFAAGVPARCPFPLPLPATPGRAPGLAQARRGEKLRPRGRPGPGGGCGWRLPPPGGGSPGGPAQCMALFLYPPADSISECTRRKQPDG